MNLIQLRAGKEDYNRAWGITVALLGVEAYVSRTRGGVWSFGFWVEWSRLSWDKTIWRKKK